MSETTIAIATGPMTAERGDYISVYHNHDCGGVSVEVSGQFRVIAASDHTLTTRKMHRWRWLEWLRARAEDVLWRWQDR